MKQTFKYILLTLLSWAFLSQCVIMKNRWPDKKATRVFAVKNVPLEIKDTIINNRHIHYTISGPKTLPTLVFLHGSPGSWMNYMHFMWDTIMQQKYRMVAIDRPGFGYSNFGKALNLQEQSNLISTVLLNLKTAEPMILFGHSLGGSLVIKLGAENPTLFSKIIIAAGAIDPLQEKKETWRKIMNIKPLKWLMPGAFAPSNTELLYLKKDLIPLKNDFSKITCDVQFIHGDKDTWVPIENIAYGKLLLIKAKSITTDTLKGADHQFPWKRKDELIRLLIK